MLGLRGHAPCRSLLSSTPSARLDCKSFTHFTSRRSLRNCRSAVVQAPGVGAANCPSNQQFRPRCSAQPDFEEHTPEIVEESDLPAHFSLQQQDADAHQLQPSSGPQRLASWALGHQQKGITTLLGFAGVALAGIAGIDLRGPASSLQAISVLAAIVTIHELGHFIAARSQNIHVTKFSIGFGPALFKYQGKDVEYALRAIPLGGFVAFPDDDPKLIEKYPKDDPNLLKNRPIKDRALVISAGIIANCIFAFSILLTQVSTVGIVESKFSTGVVIPQVFDNAVGQKAGIRVGDTIMKLNGRFMKPSMTAVNDLVNYIKIHPNEVLNFTIDRKGESLEIPVTPAEAPDGTGRIGVQLAANAQVTRKISKDPLEAIQLAAGQFGKLTKTIVTGLQQIVTNFSKTAEGVSGPVAIVAVGSEIARSDLSGLFQFAAIVNINLAVVNALPLPALDGGFLALLLAEAVRGKKLDQKVEQSIQASGVLLLTLVAVVLVVRDTINLGSGKPFM
ncbi:hypothetical protein ABBQ38_002288 [Trebouxia sp. C0009 RCD-2024]